ncbi:MAG: preprotein translocase subunit YajC [Acidimicrobiales bacterium]
MEILIFWALIGGAMWFLLIRPQQQRAKAQRALVQSLEVGDDVVTIGGMLATIVALEGDEVVVEPAPGLHLRFRRPAISGRVPDPVDLTGDDDDNGDDDDMIR